MSDATWTVKKGDRLERSVAFVKSGHDWTGTTVTSEIRRTYGSEVIVSPTLATDTTVSGTLTLTVSLTGEQTEAATMPTGTYKMDFVLERASPAFGPYTPVEVALVIAPRVTE